MGFLDFLRRRRPDDQGFGSGSTATDSSTMAPAAGTAAISPEGNVPPADDRGGGGDPAATDAGDTGAAGYDSGGGFEGGGADGGGGGDSGGGGGDSGGGG